MPSANMGVIVKFYRGAWWIFVRSAGRRRSKKIGDHETALEVAKKIRERLGLGDLGILSTAPNETLDEYAKAWLRGLTGNLKAPRFGSIPTTCAVMYCRRTGLERFSS